MKDYRKQFAFAERLNSARKKAGMTQKEVAEAAEIPISTIGHYMRGNIFPNPKRLQAMADIFGVSVDSLMGETTS